MTDSQGFTIHIGDKLKSTQRGLPVIKVIDIQGDTAILKYLPSGRESKCTQTSMTHSSWVIATIQSSSDFAGM
jgi:hypothetical protein